MTVSIQTPLLSILGLTKRFGPSTVVDQIDWEVRAGEVHALLGANGAGKSTLCKMLTGLLKPDAGTMTLAGENYAPANRLLAEKAGVQIVLQELNLIPTLTVAENLLLTHLPSTWGVIHRRTMRDKARTALDHCGMQELDVDRIVGELGVGQLQMIEIARGLMQECKLLILDEPTAALSVSESEKLFQWMDQLRRQGVSIIFISHRLNEVLRIADRVTVLRDGQLISTQNIAEVTTDSLIALMSGQSTAKHLGNFQSHRTEEIGFQVEHLTRGRLVRDISFTVQRGERFGIAGLVGSGRTELLRCIYGADRAEAGHVLIGSHPSPRRFQHPQEAVAAGLAMMTEDRKQNGLLLPLSVRVNTTLNTLWRNFSTAGVINVRSEVASTVHMNQLLATKTTGPEQAVSKLSGGNQQKVILARWLLAEGEVLLFDEPTRGVDLVARRQIYALFEQLTQQQKSLIIVSSDLEELLETCDRIGVMSNGRLVDIFDRADWSQEKLTQAFFAGYLETNN
jgi:ribose transport system ATP-binding protein